MFFQCLSPYDYEQIVLSMILIGDDCLKSRPAVFDVFWTSINLYPAEVIYLNFQPLEVVVKCLKITHMYLFILRPNIYKSSCLNSHFIHKMWFSLLIKQIKHNYCRD